MFIKLYFIALPVFLIIDFLWLGLISRNFYQKQIGFLMKTNINWPAALIFYALFVAGLVFFVISPAYLKKDWIYALFGGAFFGLITYATYDLTNLATLKNWPLTVTLVDLVWGMVLSGTVALISYFIASNFKV